MNNHETNYIVLRSILGSCLSYINKLMPLWYYGILLPEVDDDILSYLFNLTIVQLKQILESCGIITIKDNSIKCVIYTSDHEGNYSWSMFLLENSSSSNNFTKMSVSNRITLSS